MDRCYTHPTLHAVTYVINWASVWINPVIYIIAQKKYQVLSVLDIQMEMQTMQNTGPNFDSRMP